MPTDVRQHAFGRYVIRSGRVAGAWQASGFLGKRRVASANGGDEASAISRVKAELEGRDAQERAERGPDGAPSARAYAEALGNLRLAKHEEAMLEAHVNAPDRLITATQLAAAGGYDEWSTANLLYGKLGRRLADALDYSPPKRRNGSTIWTYTLATAPQDQASDEDPSIEELYEALERHLANPHFHWLLGHVPINRIPI